MNIETKYKYDDEVYYMDDNHVKNDTVYNTNITIQKNNTPTISYNLKTTPGKSRIETNLFKTKEELLKSL